MQTRQAIDWIDEYCRKGVVWYAKRLSANDTLANKAHQAGPYVPKDLLFELFPELNQPEAKNPRAQFELHIDSHSDLKTATAIWYNNKLHGGTRNETRVTNLGGAKSALLDPDATGSLVVFAFVPNKVENTISCHIWICETGEETELFEERLGPVEPRQNIIWRPGISIKQPDLFDDSESPSHSCWLDEKDIPQHWRTSFPTGREIIKKAIQLRPLIGMSTDKRLVSRRSCEFEVFRSVERLTWLSQIKLGFDSVDGFLSLAQTILQSRKSRSGNSLEYHLVEIFGEEGLTHHLDFAHTPSIENGKKPDFLFPSLQAYNDSSFPVDKLRMLAVKTTCKDRWRQILNEADRIKSKHLLTLQEGVSENQFREMCEAGVLLVVPESIQKSYPASIRGQLISLERFISEVRPPTQ